jgi:type I restriction enzyme M protein
MSTLTTQQKSDIDKLWTEFWTGGITNPLTVIEQISFLMFSRLLDVAETTAERKAERTKAPFKGRFDGPNDPRRWKNFKHLPATVADSDRRAGMKSMLDVVRDDVFAHFRKLGGGTTFSEYMQDAQLMVQKPSLLVSAVNMIDKLPITEGDAKGDLYEYLLSKLTTAGINGQFRTPRHIIRFMCELLALEPHETIGDPACGTGGFLVGAMQYLLETYTSDEGRITGENGQVIHTGDKLEPYREHIQNGMFHGFDFDATMLRIASMNLMLHGVDNPDIHYQDTLSNSFPEKFGQQASDGFDVILANPPFKGSLDEGDVHPSLTKEVKTKKTELLFVTLILRMLKKGGRSATIVPDGVLFGSSKAHVALRTLLVKHNQLEGIISLPSGVFKPYAGVSTAIVVFRKGGKTDNVFFYDVGADGFSLDDKRDPISANDLPDALARWKNRDAKRDTDRTARHFMVPVKEIEEKGFDLSINRYKETRHESVEHESPKVIIAKLRALEAEIAKELGELEGLL